MLPQNASLEIGRAAASGALQMGVLQPPQQPPLSASIHDVSLSRRPHAATRKRHQ